MERFHVHYGHGTYPEILRGVADWLDTYDDQKAHTGERNVQEDLRKLAVHLEQIAQGQY